MLACALMGDLCLLILLFLLVGSTVLQCSNQAGFLYGNIKICISQVITLLD